MLTFQFSHSVTIYNLFSWKALPGINNKPDFIPYCNKNSLHILGIMHIMQLSHSIIKVLM